MSADVATAEPPPQPVVIARPGMAIRRKVAIAGVVMGLIVVSAIGAVALSTRVLVTTVDRNTTRYNPALVSSATLLVGLVDQESGLRGYMATRDKLFLRPYDEGLALQSKATAELRRYVGEDPRVAQALRELIDAMDEWHSKTAVVRISQVAAGKSVSLADANEDNRRFETVRAKQTALNDQLSSLLAAGRQQRSEATTALTRLAILLVAILALSLALGAQATSRWIIRPLLRLRDETRKVVAGNFGHVVTVEGPREIHDVSADVEAMRQRITSELAEVDRARAEADEKAAALEQSNADLEQFAYVASHDLQEPLRKVSNFCQLLERQYAADLDDRARQYIGFSVDGARRMQKLIQDLLSFSRVGRTTEGFEPVNLAEVAAAAVATLDTEIDPADAIVTVDPNLPTVLGDASLLETLFQNLIGNAVKYRGDEPPRVFVEYGGVEDDAHLITITDNGIGIDPKYAERIFVIFQRLHLRDEYGGTGIGLAICRKIVDYHHGKIWLDLDYASGARFWVSLPIIGETDE